MTKLYAFGGHPADDCTTCGGILGADRDGQRCGDCAAATAAEGRDIRPWHGHGRLNDALWDRAEHVYNDDDGEDVDL